jgi:hypothetical protein
MNTQSMPDTVIGLMATKNRPQLAHRAAHQFVAQQYAGKKTLIIYDDGERDVRLCAALIASGQIILVKHTPLRLPIKRNRMMAHAVGLTPNAIYVIWDDDDYHGIGRLQRQVDALNAAPKAEGCLFCPLYWYERGMLKVALKQTLHGLKFRVFCDATLAMRRSLWERLPWDETRDPNAGWQWIKEPHNVIISADSGKDYIVVRQPVTHLPVTFESEDKIRRSFWRDVETGELTAVEAERLLGERLTCESLI